MYYNNNKSLKNTLFKIKLYVTPVIHSQVVTKVNL